MFHSSRFALTTVNFNTVGDIKIAYYIFINKQKYMEHIQWILTLSVGEPASHAAGSNLSSEGVMPSLSSSYLQQVLVLRRQ